jgi:hypothetical protein
MGTVVVRSSQALSQYKILLQKGHNFKLSKRCNSLNI